MIKSALWFAIPTVLVGSVMLVTPACSSDSAPSSNPPVTFGTTGVVAGAADSHCGTKVVTVDQASCKAPPSGDATDAGDATDGGDAGNNDTSANAGAANGDFGTTNFGFEADDDDCKYHVKWAMNTNAENANVELTAVVTSKADGTPEHGMKISAEVFLNDTHPAPNSGQTYSETSTAGTYSIGPVKFDAPGQWTVRFHFDEDCNDNDTSPHGHAAFFVNVP